MTNNQLTRGKVQWLHDAAEEAAAVGIKLTMNPSELLMFTSELLATMDSEPVVYTDERNLGYIDRGRETAYLWGKQNSEASDVALYRHAQLAPVVSADLLHTAASAIEDLLTTKDRVGAGVWFDLPSRLRSAANAQPAPVVPDERPSLNNGIVGFDEGWNACRAAMLAVAPPAPTSTVK